MADLKMTEDRIEDAAPGFKAMLTATGLGNSERFIRLLAERHR